MKKIATFDMYPDTRRFRVFDAEISDKITTYHTAESFYQGFSARPGSFNFSTFGECIGIIIEVWAAKLSEQISLLPETLRAILLPFSVGKQGIKVGNFIEGVEEPVSIPEGNYALLFELKLRDDVEYLNSPEYQENAGGGWTEEWCRLTFYPKENAVQAEILRLDTEPTLPYPVEGYIPLNPTYPLLMGVEFA